MRHLLRTGKTGGVQWVLSDPVLGLAHSEDDRWVSLVLMAKNEFSEDLAQDGWAASSEDPFDSTPSGRALRAVELLAKTGPMTYKSLAQALSMTRAATWRLVASLREANWVCIRHGGSLIQLNPRLDDLFATADFADAEFIAVANAMSDVANALPVHIDLYAPNRNGDLVLHETTRRLTVSAPLSDVPDDLLLLAMHAAMTPPQLERYAAQMKVRDVEAFRQVFSASGRRRIQHFPGLVWSNDLKSLIISVRGSMGTAAALRISAKSGTARQSTLNTAFSQMHQHLKDKTEMFGSNAAPSEIMSKTDGL